MVPDMAKAPPTRIANSTRGKRISSQICHSISSKERSHKVLNESASGPLLTEISVMMVNKMSKMAILIHGERKRDIIAPMLDEFVA